jgi:hypothetical protein
MKNTIQKLLFALTVAGTAQGVESTTNKPFPFGHNLSSPFSTVLSYLDPQDMQKVAKASHKMSYQLYQTPAIGYRSRDLVLDTTQDHNKRLACWAYGPKGKRTEAILARSLKGRGFSSYKSESVNRDHPVKYAVNDKGYIRGTTQKEIWPNTAQLYHYVKDQKAHVRLNNQLCPVLEKVSVQGNWPQLTIEGGHVRPAVTIRNNHGESMMLPDESYSAPAQLKSLDLRSSNEHAKVAVILQRYLELPNSNEERRAFFDDFDRTHYTCGLASIKEKVAITDFIRMCPSLQKVTVPCNTLSSNDLEHLKSQGWDAKVQDGHFALKKRPIQHQAEESKE